MRTIFFACVYIFFLASGLFAQEAKDVEETSAQIQALLGEAEASVNMMDFDLAIKQLNTSLALSKTINHQRFIALSSSILAKLYYIRHDYDLAATELQRAISIQRKIEDNEGLAYSYINYAKIFNAQQDLNRAKRYLNLAEKIYTKEENHEYLGIISLNRAVITLNLENNLQKALQHLDQAKNLLTESKNEYEHSRLYYYSSRANLLTGNLDKAMQNAEKVEQLSLKNNYQGMLMNTNRLISNIYEERGDSENALTYLKTSNNLRDSIFRNNKEALAMEANSKYGVDAMQSSLNELALQNAEQKRSLKVNKLTTILSIALITILSLLTFSLYKNNNLRARANKLLQKKNTELTKAKENAEKASLAKAQFLSTITHELRTPLYAVTGLTHLLLEENPSENQKEHLNSLKFSGEYLLSLINNILDLNKLEANKVEVLKTNFNLKKRISDVLIALKNSADEKNTKIHFDFDPTIPKELKGDPVKIAQILINLIGNSIKFTKDGDIWVSVDNIKQDNTFIWLDFKIKDNGEGISKENQKAIFENFTQGSTQINRKFGGTGLGLSIVKNLLTLLGSEITLNSNLGQGSCFSFQLKFETLNSPKFQDTENRSLNINNDAIQGKTILVVEDNKINQMITRKILERNKVVCILANNGQTAIEKVKSEEPDLVLMDIHMPGISGIEASKEIRKFNKKIPIIALTAVTLDNNLEEFYKNGINDIIPKPYKTEEFFSKISTHITKSESTA